MRTFRVLMTVGALSLAGAPVWAQEADADTSKEAARAGGGGPTEVAAKPLDDRIKAVQGKKFIKRLRFEIYPWAGVSLNDAFYRYYHAGLAGTFHIMEGLAVEGGMSAAPIRQVLEPVIFLRQQKSAIPATGRYFGNVWMNLQLSPIYGKMAIFSEWIMHYDLFVLAGAGVVLDSAFWYLHPQLHCGIGSRVFLFDWMVLRADIRASAYPQGEGLTLISNIQNQLTAMAGVGFYIPPFFDHETSSGRRK